MLSVSEFELFSLSEYVTLMNWMGDRFDGEIFLISSLLEGDSRPESKENRNQLLLTLKNELLVLQKQAIKGSSSNRQVARIMRATLTNLNAELKLRVGRK